MTFKIMNLIEGKREVNIHYFHITGRTIHVLLYITSAVL